MCYNRLISCKVLSLTFWEFSNTVVHHILNPVKYSPFVNSIECLLHQPRNTWENLRVEEIYYEFWVCSLKQKEHTCNEYYDTLYWHSIFSAVVLKGKMYLVLCSAATLTWLMTWHYWLECIEIWEYPNIHSNTMMLLKIAPDLKFKQWAKMEGKLRKKFTVQMWKHHLLLGSQLNIEKTRDSYNDIPMGYNSA